MWAFMLLGFCNVFLCLLRPIANLSVHSARMVSTHIGQRQRVLAFRHLYWPAFGRISSQMLPLSAPPVPSRYVPF